MEIIIPVPHIFDPYTVVCLHAQRPHEPSAGVTSRAMDGGLAKGLVERTLDNSARFVRYGHNAPQRVSHVIFPLVPRYRTHQPSPGPQVPGGRALPIRGIFIGGKVPGIVERCQGLTLHNFPPEYPSILRHLPVDTTLTTQDSDIVSADFPVGGRQGEPLDLGLGDQ